MNIIQIFTLLAISVDALKRGKFGRLGHFVRHHGQSGPVQHKPVAHNRPSRPLRSLPYGLKWPKKTATHHQERLQKRLKKSARRLLCQDVTCNYCITYYGFDEENPVMKTECPETTTGLKASLVHGICCEQEN